MSNLYPSVDFLFKLSFSGESAAAFQEVTGISMEMDTEDIAAGGENKYQYRVPKGVKYSNLVLNRGLMAKDSALAKWCADTFTGITNQIETKSLMVDLVDEKGKSLASWHFVNAYPVKWAVADLDSMHDEIAIESLEFSYSYFEYKPTPLDGINLFD